jgi:LPXTG-motif cell wall-anchored protein
VAPTTATPSATAGTTPSSGSTAAAGPMLPRTGPSTGLLVGTGLVLVVAGAVTLLLLRRRRAGDTA